MRKRDGHRHQFRSLITCVTKHQSLVARTFSINTHGDVRALAVKCTEHVASVSVESDVVAGVADFSNNLASHFNVIDFGFGCDFAGKYHEVRSAQCFAGNARHWVLSQQSVKDSVRHLIRNFVRMSHAD